MDKNLPANAGDMGSIPGPERFHMLLRTTVLSLHAALLTPRHLEPMLCNKRRHGSEKLT